MTHRTRRWLKAGAVVAVVALVAVAVLWTRCGIRGCPDVDLLNGYVPDEASVVLDRDGKEVSKLYRVRRTVVPLDSLPEYVPEAFIAVEDREFYEHGGVDWSRAVGALAANVRAGGVAEGFSTITMQLARNLFPEKLPAEQRTLWRKLGEIRVAQEIEDKYSKDEILEMYLNQIYFGEGAWGIQAASQEYFGKPAAELEVEEAALLAGLPKAPSRLNPRVNRAAALERRNLVLRRMAAQGLVGAAEAEALMEEEIDLARTTAAEAGDRAPYFVEEVRRRMEQQLGPALYTEGYTIHTTLDLDAQEVAEAELERQLERIDGGELQGAVVTMDAQSGDVIALVGGRDFEESKFNRATQAKRQPGSAFKPFVYAAALAAGYPPTQPLEDTPLRLVRSGDVWEPENYGGEYSGMVTLREALVQSKNVATIRLAQQVGLDQVIQTARRMGIDEEIPPYPSVVLGTVEVTPLELTAAYASFATLGSRPEPRFVTAVEDRNGNLVWAQPVETERVVDPDVAFLVTDILSDVVSRGTGTAVRAVGFRAPAAGKTGTTNEGTDAWFVGYTPELVTTVWIGYDDPRPIGGNATGGGLAAPVWGRIMSRIGAGGGGWRVPAGVESFAVTEQGTPIPLDCPGAETLRQEYFLSGRAPVGGCSYDYAEYDDLHGDTLLGEPVEREDAWWDRMRRRVFGEDEAATPRETRPAPPVTTEPSRTAPPAAERPQASPADTVLRPAPTSRDTARGGAPARRVPAKPEKKPLGVPVRPDTLSR